LVMLRNPTSEAVERLTNDLRLLAQDAAQLQRQDIRQSAGHAEDALREFLVGGPDSVSNSVRSILELGQILLLALGSEIGHPTLDAEPAKHMARRLLVVDDSRVAAAAISKAFAVVGFLVRSAATMADALAELTSFAPSVLVSDVHMPDLDVDTLCKSFRALSRKRPTLVILVSGTTGEELDRRLAQVKPDAFVAKMKGTAPVVDAVMKLWKDREGASQDPRSSA
jgi:CheY-like chemotaxis protein